MVSLIHHHTRHTGPAEFVSRLALQDEAAEATPRGAWVWASDLAGVVPLCALVSLTAPSVINE